GLPPNGSGLSTYDISPPRGYAHGLCALVVRTPHAHRLCAYRMRILYAHSSCAWFMRIGLRRTLHIGSIRCISPGTGLTGSLGAGRAPLIGDALCVLVSQSGKKGVKSGMCHFPEANTDSSHCRATR